MADRKHSAPLRGRILWVALCAALTSISARADTITNLAYPSTPTKWFGIYSGDQVIQGAAIAPDGTPTAVGVVTSQPWGGLRSGPKFPVSAGQTYTYSIYMRSGEGSTVNVACIGNNPFGGTGGCAQLVFNGQTGAFISLDPRLADYSIAPLGNSGWWRISITFTPTTSANADLTVRAAGAGAEIDVWGAQLETGPYPSQLIFTANAPASGVNQISPQADRINNWTIAGSSIISPAAGRAGSSTFPAWLFTTATTGASLNISTAAKATTTYYAYMYVQKSSVNPGQAHPYLSIVLNDNGPDYVQSSISADLQSAAPLTRTSSFGTSIPSSAYIADQGSFDAGDFWVFWAKVYNGNFDDAFPGLLIQPQLSSGQVAIARVGLQEGGIFP